MSLERDYLMIKELKRTQNINTLNLDLREKPGKLLKIMK